MVDAICLASLTSNSAIRACLRHALYPTSLETRLGNWDGEAWLDGKLKSSRRVLRYMPGGKGGGGMVVIVRVFGLSISAVQSCIH